MPSKDDKTFRENLARYQHIPIDVFACNSFIPSSMKSVGPEHDQAAVLAYAEKVFQRAREAQVEVIVFGSGGSRKIPEGFSKKEAVKRSEEHTYELQSLMRISYAVFSMQKKKQTKNNNIELN